MNYSSLSLAEVRSAMRDIARDAQTTFGHLDKHQLNWRPDATRWSVAQCFEHLVQGNSLLLQAARDAMGNPPSTVWQRLPLLPAAFGWLLIRSQSPNAKGKYTAPARAMPPREVRADIIQQFVDQHRDAEAWTRALDERAASRAIMVSPFIHFVTYSVRDGLRLMVAHDRRHFEQARLVMQSPRFAERSMGHGD